MIQVRPLFKRRKPILPGFVKPHTPSGRPVQLMKAPSPKRNGPTPISIPHAAALLKGRAASNHANAARVTNLKVVHKLIGLSPKAGFAVGGGAHGMAGAGVFKVALGGSIPGDSGRRR